MPLWFGERAQDFCSEEPLEPSEAAPGAARKSSGTTRYTQNR